MAGAVAAAEELVPMVELEQDAEMMAATTKIQAVHRGRMAHKERDDTSPE